MSQRKFPGFLPKTILALLGFLFVAPIYAADSTRASESFSSEDEEDGEESSTSEAQTDPMKETEKTSVSETEEEPKNPDHKVTVEESPATSEPKETIVDEEGPPPSETKGTVVDEKGREWNWSCLDKKELKINLLRLGIGAAIVAKTVLDGAQFYFLLEQVNAVDHITPYLIIPAANCSTLCNANVRDIRDMQYKSNSCNYSSMAFSLCSISGDLLALVMYIKKGTDSTWGLASAFCFGVCDLIKWACTFAGNGFIWNGINRFSDGMPTSLIKAMNLAKETGAPHLTISSVEATVAGTILLIIYCCGS